MIYADDQRDILTGFNRLLDMMDEMAALDCAEEEQCNRDKISIGDRYQHYFDVQGMSREILPWFDRSYP